MNARLVAFCLLSIAAPSLAEPTPVKTVQAQPSKAARKFVLPAYTAPAEEARIFSRATGTVRERKVDIGDTVRAGDTLAVIDTPEIDRQVDAAAASVEVASSKAEAARRNANRSAELVKSRAVSIEESDNLEAVAQQLEAALRLSKAEQQRLVAVQSFSTLRAPFDGTIAARQIDRGDQVKADTPGADSWLFHLVRLNELRIITEVPPELALQINTGQDAKLSFPELPGSSFTAKVSRVSHTIDRTSGTMRVELALKNDTHPLPSGLTGNVSFEQPATSGTWLLPSNTLVNRAGKSFIGIVKDGKASFIEVSQGRNFGDQVEIRSADIEGANVIVSPNAMLRDGDEVTATPVPPKAKL